MNYENLKTNEEFNKKLKQIDNSIKFQIKIRNFEGASQSSKELEKLIKYGKEKGFEIE